MSLMKRSVINPIMVMSGGLTLISGLFLMFHYESHFAKAIHQIGGILLIIFAVMHIVMNRKALAASCKRQFHVWAVLVFAVCIAIMAVKGVHTPHHHKQLVVKYADNER